MKYCAVFVSFRSNETAIVVLAKETRKNRTCSNRESLFRKKKIANVFVTHVQDFFRKSVSKGTLERKLSDVSLPLGSAHTTRLRGPCRRAVFTGNVNRPASTGVQNDTRDHGTDPTCDRSRDRSSRRSPRVKTPLVLQCK